MVLPEVSSINPALFSRDSRKKRFPWENAAASGSTCSFHRKIKHFFWESRPLFWNRRYRSSIDADIHMIYIGLWFIQDCSDNTYKCIPLIINKNNEIINYNKQDSPTAFCLKNIHRGWHWESNSSKTAFDNKSHQPLFNPEPAYLRNVTVYRCRGYFADTHLHPGTQCRLFWHRWTAVPDSAGQK